MIGAIALNTSCNSLALLARSGIDCRRDNLTQSQSLCGGIILRRKAAGRAMPYWQRAAEPSEEKA